MPRPSRADALSTAQREMGAQQALSLLYALLASGVNPDGTPAAVPVESRSLAPTTRVSARAVAPVASAIIADTGALGAGDYRLQVLLSYADTLAAGKGLVVEHRNAANGANVHVLGGVPASDSREFVVDRYPLAANERIRVVNDTIAGAAGSVAVAAIVATLLT